MPLSGLFPLRDMDGWIPLFSKIDDNTDADIAIPGHYGVFIFS